MRKGFVFYFWKFLSLFNRKKAFVKLFTKKVKHTKTRKDSANTDLTLELETPNYLGQVCGSPDIFV